MWPGPYGEWGSRKYLLSSLDQSLDRMGLDYVDIFYSHRFDPDTPLEETIGALDTAVRQGKALYAGISSYSAERTKEAVEIARALGTPIMIHQPSYSLLNRWIEPEVLDICGEEGVGIIAFSPLGQGMLTDRYLGGIPADSRAAKDFYLKKDFINEENMERVKALNEIAQGRGQALAQMALAWVLRDARVTSALIGASSVEQLETNVAALENLDFSADELAEIDKYAVDAGINIWASRSVTRTRAPSGDGVVRDMTAQAQAEARELSRLATDEFSALPRGIGDIHAAISGRVFRALGPSAQPVRVVHDALSRGVYEGVRGGLWLAGHAAGSAAQARRGRRAAVGDAARRRRDRRAQRPLRRPARGRRAARWPCR